jgi:hypothetical protein
MRALYVTTSGWTPAPRISSKRATARSGFKEERNGRGKTGTGNEREGKGTKEKGREQKRRERKRREGKGRREGRGGVKNRYMERGRTGGKIPRKEGRKERCKD